MNDQVKTIRIKVSGSHARNIDELESFQGEGETELKTLTEENYKKLRREILDLGFCEPLCVWGDKILNGHQRVKTLKRMRDEEGYTIPHIPVNMVTADTYKEAKKMVLSLTSQFGKMTEESLMGFIKDADLELNEVIDGFEFAGLDTDTLTNLFGNERMDLEFQDIDDEGIPDVDIKGEVDGRTEYIILTFDNNENIEQIMQDLGLRNNIKRISYKFFVDNITGGENIKEEVNVQ